MTDQTSGSTAFIRAKKLFHEGRVKLALAVIDFALQGLPEDADLLCLKASVLHSQANWTEALAAIESVSLFAPLDVAGQLVLADCYSHLGKHDLALMGYRHLLAASNLPANYYAGLYAGFKRAEKYDLAYESCRLAIERNKGNHQAWYGLASCMSKLAYPPRDVTASMQRALDLAPEQINYRISLVVQLYLTKRRSRAYELLCECSVESLSALDRCCLIRHLMNLCAWAGDVQRCSYLGGLLAHITQAKRGQHAYPPHPT